MIQNARGSFTVYFGKEHVGMVEELDEQVKVTGKTRNKIIMEAVRNHLNVLKQLNAPAKSPKKGKA